MFDLFFGGHNVPLKRYKTFLVKLENTTHIPCHTDIPEIVTELRFIFAHSIGVLHALIFCHKHQICPKLICIDGTYLDHDILMLPISGTIY